MDNNDRLDHLERALIAGRITRRAFVAGALATGLLAAEAVPALADELDTIRAVQARNRSSLKKAYDYVVVGAGSAGCALVGTLAKREPGAQILLIEAGDWDTAESVLDPRLWFTNLDTVRDWGDVSIPSAGTNNRAIPEHTGRVVGGGSSINATIWARPFKADMDHWARVTGDRRWDYRHSLKHFKAIEDWQGTPNPAFRGTGGPVWVQPAADPLPVATAALDGFREVGLPVVDDLNGERELTGNGFGYMNQIIKDGRRNSMARAFLYPVLSRPNVTVLVNTQVNRVLLRGNHAVGVEAVTDGRTVRFGAHLEVVLSTGGFNTPKLLMLSGIGHEKELRAHGIRVRKHAPEVGKNVQDHILHGGVLFEPKEPFAYRNSAANVSGYLRSDPSFELPDVSLVQIEIPYASEVVAARYAPPPSSWALCGGLVTPKSRGTVTLRSANPADRPIVDMQFLSHPDDVAALERSIAIAREVGASSAMKPFVVREVAPGAALQGEDLANFVRDGATTYFHSSGACRMGKDDKAVVDSELRVNGIHNLRIADSTIMPRIVSVPTMPACVLIGLRMAELLS
ncbi:MAG: GMC family oxidoreductase N-terminal domain-containing protein [Actinobacteria bacterium]|nr:GMC family oxidoreductase N-terminal domain-containing protein [Actinomycetota bacterium]